MRRAGWPSHSDSVLGSTGSIVPRRLGTGGSPGGAGTVPLTWSRRRPQRSWQGVGRGYIHDNCPEAPHASPVRAGQGEPGPPQRLWGKGPGGGAGGRWRVLPGVCCRAASPLSLQPALPPASSHPAARRPASGHHPEPRWPALRRGWACLASGRPITPSSSSWN